MTPETPRIAYFFVNFYLSAIQHGIQAGHCAVKMCCSEEYRDHPDALAWAQRDHTMIVCGGHTQPSLLSMLYTFRTFDGWQDIVHGSFTEDESLNNSVTVIGFIVTADVAAAAKSMREAGVRIDSPTTVEIIRYNNGDYRDVIDLTPFTPAQRWLMNQIADGRLA